MTCMDGGDFSVFERSVLVSNGILHDKVLFEGIPCLAGSTSFHKGFFLLPWIDIDLLFDGSTWNSSRCFKARV